MKKFITILMLLFISLFAYAQTTEWYYNYSTGNDEEAKEIIYGSDGNIYVAGYTGGDILLISLKKDGSQRWAYTYSGAYPGSGTNRIVYGSDDKIYLAGYTKTEQDGSKFLVLCVDTSGVKEWEYIFADISGTYSQAYDVVRGDDGNVYACGNVDYDFFAASINNLGQQNWIYRVDGNCGYALCDDEATGIEYGAADSIYVAGYLNNGPPTGKDMYVVSLDNSGNENWTYLYDSPLSGADVAWDFILGLDGYLYVSGTGGWLGANESSITVISLNNSGTERWNFIYDGPGPKPYWGETCYRLIQGEEGNIYVAGRDGGVTTDLDFIVLSLSSLGEFNWVHRYASPIDDYDMAFALTQTPDGNLHAAGYFRGILAEFGMISVHRDTGRDLWIFRYAGYDMYAAYCITSDEEGYIYVGGYDYSSSKDLIVFKLNPPRESDGWYNFADYIDNHHTWGDTYSIIKSSDDNYVTAGNLEYWGNSSSSEVYLMKTDINCDVLWKKRIGGSNEDKGYSVFETDDGGFVVTGFTKFYGAGEKDIYLVKTDANGNLEWEKWYGGTSDEEGYAVVQTNDLGYLIAGRTSSYGQGGDIWVIKTNSAGDTLWTRVIGGTKSDQVNNVIETSVNDYLIVGSFRLQDNSSDLYAIRINANGDTLWTKKYDRNNRWDAGYDIVEVENGNFLIAGYLDSRNALLKINNLGDTLWTKTYGPEDPTGFVSMSKSSDGNYFLLKPDDYLGVGFSSIYKVDTDGNILDTDSLCLNKNYPANYGDSKDIQSTPFGGYIISGSSRIAVSGTTAWNPTLIRKGGELTLLTDVEEEQIDELIPQSFLLYQNYPNPFNPSTKIRFSIPMSGNVTLKIYDILGREIKTLLNEYKQTGTYETSFDGSGLASGIYFYQLRAGDFVQTKKMILIK
jgi:hypothetical protein